MQETPCIFCKTHSPDVAITEKGFTGVKCDDCNLIYISPRPTDSVIINLYTDEHAVLYADAQFQFDRFNRMAAKRTLSTIARYKDSGSLLELGPGGGCFLLEARNLGYKTYGIELNPIEQLWISKQLHISCENKALNEDSFGGRKFDIIYHKDVLSHLTDPIEAFRSINNALKPEGLLVFETGNIADVKKVFYKWFSQFSYPDHLFFFGERSLNTLLEKTGFRCIHLYRDNIALQLLLQKALWNKKELLKDSRKVGNMEFLRMVDCEGGALSLKRRLRLCYRYVSHYLTKCGAIFPQQGWPLKLLVVARKNLAPSSPRQ